MRRTIVIGLLLALPACEQAPDGTGEVTMASLDHCRSQGAQNEANCRSALNAWEDGFDAALRTVENDQEPETVVSYYRASGDDGGPREGFADLAARCLAENSELSVSELPRLYRKHNAGQGRGENACRLGIDARAGIITGIDRQSDPAAALANSPLAVDGPSPVEPVREERRIVPGIVDDEE